MANYSKMEEFLFRAEQDLTGDIVLYRINRDGGIERLKFNYDGTDMYLLAVKAVWGMNDNPSIVYVSYTRIEEWKIYRKKAGLVIRYAFQSIRKYQKRLMAVL